MSCGSCLGACDIYSCYSNLYVGKVSSTNTLVTVYIEHIATGRVVFEDVTTTGAGVVLLAAGTWEKMLKTESPLKVRVVKDGADQDITMYSTPTVFESDTTPCITFHTQPLYTESGYMYAMPNQYLLKA